MMRRTFRLTRVAALMIFAGLATDAIAQETKIEGTWLIVSAKEDGDDTKEPVGDKVTFTAEKMTIQPKDASEKAPPPLPIKIDTTKKPWQIDITFKKDDDAKTAKGVIALKDGMLILCFAPPGEARPTALESEKDTGQMSLVFKRSSKDGE